jgi:RNA polymerase sigma-70 factor (ECF subfamily)
MNGHLVNVTRPPTTLLALRDAIVGDRLTFEPAPCRLPSSLTGVIDMLFQEQRKKRLQTYQSDMLSYANAITRDADLAQDLSQDCVIRILNAKNAPVEERAYKAWMFTILRNLWLDHLRRNVRWNRFQLDEMAEHIPASIDSEVAVVNAISVRIAFDQLSDDHRDVLSLVDLGGFSYQETAEIFGVSIGTVMSRVSRARSRMCTLLDQSNVIDLQTKKKQARR